MIPACFVFGAGPSPSSPPIIAKQDMVIAADGGYLYTQRMGIHADAVIGDFDSLGGVPKCRPDGPLVIQLPKEKEQTDTFSALKYGLERDFKVFHIYGGMGGRFDHTLANIQCLTFLLKHGARGYLYYEDTVTTALSGGVCLAPMGNGMISVFAIGGTAEGVCLHGLKYELENAILTPDFPLGVSNEFIGRSVYISVKRGSLLIIYPHETHEIPE